MHRRSLLSVAPAGALWLAGCATIPHGGGTGTVAEERTETTDSRRTEGITPGTETTTSTNNTANELPAPIDLDDLQFGAAVVRQFSTGGPARIGVTMTNESDLPMLLAGGPTPVFSGYFGERKSGEATLALIPDDTTHIDVTGSEPVNVSEVTYVPPSPTEGCWRWPYPDHDLTVHAVLVHVEIPPGGAIDTTYSVLDYRNERCLPAGMYEFENEVGLFHGTHENHRFHTEKRTSVALGFTLTIGDDRSVSVSARQPIAEPGDG